MASIIRKGKVPNPPTGMGPYQEQLFTLNGFFGHWAQIYRHRNLSHPKTWSDEVMYMGADTNSLTPSDLDDPAGAPLTLLSANDVSVSLSRRSQAPPFAEKNADFHQIRLYQRGTFLLETELGPLTVSAGDMVVIPKGLIYRETPHTIDNSIIIFETKAVIQTAEAMWDSVGFAASFIDYSEMVIPEPGNSDRSPDIDTEVRVRVNGEYHFLGYDFDPCNDVVAWLGDPLIFSLNIWSMPGAGTSNGWLPPPSGAVFIGEDKSFVFNVMAPKPFPTRPAPNGSLGAPGHLNDYDEVWFNHVSESVPETDGHIWRLPPSLPHPGLKRPPEYPPNPVREIREVKINFDTRSVLTWSEEARTAFLPDPQVSIYTSLYGTHIGAVPDNVLEYVKK
jgi:homogentisate 1,2-dioxygenase